MIPGSDDDMAFCRGSCTAQKPVIKFLRIIARRAVVKNIARNQNHIDVFVFNQFRKPVQKCFMLVVTFAVVKRTSQMPVGGMEDFHFRVILPAYKQFFPTEYHRLGGFVPPGLKTNRLDRFSKLQQPLFGIGMIFTGAVFQHVPDQHVVVAQMPADQDCAMTRQRVLFSAHKRDPVRRHAFSETVEPLLNNFFLSQALKLNLPVFVTGRIGASRPQFRPQIDIGYPLPDQLFFQCFTIELRCKTAVRAGTDIAHRIDAVHVQKLQKPFYGMNRMSDGKQFFHGLIACGREARGPDANRRCRGVSCLIFLPNI